MTKKQTLRAALFALCCTLFLAPGTSALQRYEALTPKDVSDFSFENQDGLTVSLKDYKGKIVVLNVWSISCGPCIAEMPSIDQLSGFYDEKDLVVIPMSIDPIKMAALRTWFEKSHYKYIVPFADPTSKSREIFGWTGLPTTLIINREGQWIGRVVGSISWNSSESLQFFDALIAGKNPPVQVSFFKRMKEKLNALIGRAPQQ